MNTNYDSARAIVDVLASLDYVPSHVPVECVLPLDDSYEVCTPDHLRAALCLLGFDARVVESGRPDTVITDVLTDGGLAILCLGPHSAPRQRRWLLAFDECDRSVSMYAGGFDTPPAYEEPAHFCRYIVVVNPKAGDGRPEYHRAIRRT